MSKFRSAQQEPLSYEEQLQLAQLLSEGEGRSLLFARGVFAAVATSPKETEPTAWLSLILGAETPTREQLRLIFDLLMRDFYDIAARLARREEVAPEQDNLEALVEFSRGYVQIAQKNSAWTSSQRAFDLTLPLMVVSGYVEIESLKTVAPEAAADPEGFTKQCRARLGEAVLALYTFFAEARKRQATETESQKVGRNEPCPCGSGKKYKRCCGQ